MTSHYLFSAGKTQKAWRRVWITQVDSIGMKLPRCIPQKQSLAVGPTIIVMRLEQTGARPVEEFRYL